MSEPALGALRAVPLLKRGAQLGVGADLNGRGKPKGIQMNEAFRRTSPKPGVGGWGAGGEGEGCITREGTSEAAPEAVRQAVGGGCQSGGGRLLSVTNAIEAGTWREGDSGWA